VISVADYEAYDALQAERDELRELADTHDADFEALDKRWQAEVTALQSQLAQLTQQMEDARRNAYIRGFQRGYDKKAEIQKEGPQTSERVRIWAESHAISYCDQFDEAALTPAQEAQT
jgi:hypothetical protein